MRELIPLGILHVLLLTWIAQSLLKARADLWRIAKAAGEARKDTPSPSPPPATVLEVRPNDCLLVSLHVRDGTRVTNAEAVGKAIHQWRENPNAGGQILFHMPVTVTVLRKKGNGGDGGDGKKDEGDFSESGAKPETSVEVIYA